MGKIFNALEKFYSERNALAEPSEPLQQADLDALMQFNRYTGKLNINSQSIIREPGSIQRLISHQLILEDGRVTEAGKLKCEELTYMLRVSLAGRPEHRPSPPPEPESSLAESVKPPEPLKTEDVAALLDRDLQTGHLMKYDPATGQLDKNSLQILNNPGLLQRLVGHGLIFPGGKLTPKGVEECIRLQEQPPAAPAPVTEKQPSKAFTLVPVQTRSPISVAEEPHSKAGDAIDDEFIETYAPDPTPSRALQKPEKKPAAPDRGVTAAISPNLVSLLAPQSIESEQFKILRTNLLFPTSGTPPRSVLITSVEPEDGKSFVAANLAVSVALNINRYVLLVDADLRRPTIHKQFGFGDVPGLSEYLSKGAALPSLLLQTKVDRLTILPGGAPPENPSELLSSERMASLLKEITERYSDRLIIIDTPPPTLTAETGVLARRAEGIILVAKYSKTSRVELKKLVEQLGREKIVGCVMNYFDYQSAGPYGYREYEKYKGYKH